MTGPCREKKTNRGKRMIFCPKASKITLNFIHLAHQEAYFRDLKDFRDFRDLKDSSSISHCAYRGESW